MRPRRFRQQLLQVVPLARCISSFCTHDPCGRDLRKARLIASSTTLVPFCPGQVLIRPAHEGKNHVAESANTCIWGAAFFFLYGVLVYTTSGRLLPSLSWTRPVRSFGASLGDQWPRLRDERLAGLQPLWQRTELRLGCRSSGALEDSQKAKMNK